MNPNPVKSVLESRLRAAVWALMVATANVLAPHAGIRMWQSLSGLRTA
jgi:hypothetical protein